MSVKQQLKTETALYKPVLPYCKGTKVKSKRFVLEVAAVVQTRDHHSFVGGATG